jgi:hypothetical protein
MHIKRIHLDEVFDAPWRRGAFSFRSGGQPTYGVRLPGWRVPPAGSTLALAFERPGDWRSVIGWHDLATGRITLRDPAWAIVLHKLSEAWEAAPIVLAACLLLCGVPGLWLALAVIVGTSGYFLRGALRRNGHVRAALLAIQAG